MEHSKPFFRLSRPNKERQFRNYVLDERYAPDRYSLIHAYHILERDLIKVFDYIDPSDDNLLVYSHRIFELYLRASTEFESNCTAILYANGYKSTKNLSITDYYKLDKILKLNEYSVKTNIWTPQPKVFSPFSDWANRTEFTPLSWYKNYNLVKHNRNVEFKLANLDNLLQAMSGLFVILFSQFDIQVFDPYQECSSWFESEDGYISYESRLFSITAIRTWTEEERYNFKWEEIKNFPEPFTKHIIQ